ncbi:uncharacterized protein I303_106384 [Kwoniella dejecticola CBS 10117]|uniref:Uncharacterized protein n=1 Tax=Kwoniella dejecticola CBS 10117 TaxID=1296121 RepID=A0A1A5ZUV1_9TREE|nr:uncharacterized protein I303_08359 [Kwoniella dejecticola CBS 10117]OBR81588.1 hypothetical protein I303_08359 [Kwoniella dejecticola CBS 10117]
MSNKPTYAAIVNPHTDTSSTSNSKGNGNSGISSSVNTTGGPSDAPPPYTEPSHNQNPGAIPHQTILPPPPQHQRDLESASASASARATNGWTPPASYAVARSRALKRFWSAFLWAWLIWIGIGLLIGGGVSDISNDESRGHHGHWDKHGDWHNDKGGVYFGSGAVSLMVMARDKAIGAIPDFA